MQEMNIFKIAMAEGHSVSEPTLVATVHGTQTAEVGEWIITADDGGRHVVPESVVDAYFWPKEKWVGTGTERTADRSEILKVRVVDVSELSPDGRYLVDRAGHSDEWLVRLAAAAIPEGLAITVIDGLPDIRMAEEDEP